MQMSPPHIIDVENYLISVYSEAGVANAKNVVHLVLSDVLKEPYTSLLLKQRRISQSECDELDSISDKIIQGMPVQYALGHAPFRYLDLKVNKSVLIPRPETELMVDFISYYVKEQKIDEPLIADIGTGSGCIAISCAKEIKNCHVYATDISKEAIEVAKTNAENNDVFEQIDFEVSNCLDKFDYYQHSRNLFNVIASNPPYVPTGVYENLDDEVKLWEPTSALDGGKDGLDVFKSLVESAKHLIEPNGLLIVELFEEHMQKAKQYAIEQGFKNVAIKNDLCGKNRFLLANG
jgi:release factor glutamine methyltransferase